jgi:hypothetical protein
MWLYPQFEQRHDTSFVLRHCEGFTKIRFIWYYENVYFSECKVDFPKTEVLENPHMSFIFSLIMPVAFVLHITTLLQLPIH